MKLQKLGPVGPDNFGVREPGAHFCTGRSRSKNLIQDYSSSVSCNCFLCFAGRFRLSGITRVTAGAIPDFRAARRASTPLSMTAFRFRFIESLFRGQFPNGAPGLIDCFIRISKRTSIRIRNVDAAKRLAADFAG